MNEFTITEEPNKDCILSEECKNEGDNKKQKEPQGDAPLVIEHISKCTFSQSLTAVAVSLISMVIGYTIAFTSPADISLRKTFHVGHRELSWIGGLLPLSAIFGGITGGIFIEYCSRKGTLFLTNLFFFISWIILYCATNSYHLYISRCLAGFGTGIATLTLPVYLVETIQSEVRGILGLLPMTFGNIGILMSFTIGLYADWKKLALMGILLTIPFLIIFIWLIPETPVWYITHEKQEKGRKILIWLRDGRQDVTQEYNELIRKYGERKTNEIKLINLFKAENFEPLIIVLGLMFFQQFSGINAVIFYSTSIFDAAITHFSPAVCTLIIGIVNLISTFIADAFIDKLGRKMLLQVSSILMTLGLGCLGFYYYLKDIIIVDMTLVTFLPLSSLVIFVLGFSIGFGPIPWLMMGELLPVEIKSIAASIATSLNWTCTFIITLTFPSAAHLFGYFAVFWFYCCMTIAAAIVVWLFVPETRGIEVPHSNQTMRNVKSMAKMKPFPISV